MDYRDMEIDFLRRKIELKDKLIADYEVATTAINSVVDRALRFPYKYEQMANELEKKSDTTDNALKVR